MAEIVGKQKSERRETGGYDSGMVDWYGTWQENQKT